MRLHPVTTLHGLPVGYMVAGAKADERETLLSMLDRLPVAVPAGQVIMADKGYNGRWLEEELSPGGVELLRPARKGENPVQAGSFSNLCGRPSSRCLTP